jgi:hypothetical protein
MAITLPDDEVGTAFGLASGTAPLDGLTQVIYDRVDMDYGPVNEGAVTVKRQRLITLVYEPTAAQGANLDYYGNIGAILNVRRKISAGAGKADTLYKTTIKEVLHQRYGANLHRYTIICMVDSAEFNPGE